MRVLIVEDDRSIADFVASGLRQEGFAVDIADNGVDGLDLARSQPYAAAVVDVMLPHGGRLRMVTACGGGVTNPVMFLERAPLGDDAQGAADGGDDIDKPFAFPELLARSRRSRGRAKCAEPTS